MPENAAPQAGKAQPASYLQAIKQIANRLEQAGQQDAAKLLRIHLNRLVPNLWEDELFCKDQPALWDTDAGQAR